jgi:hypothetical protein
MSCRAYPKSQAKKRYFQPIGGQQQASARKDDSNYATAAK